MTTMEVGTMFMVFVFMGVAVVLVVMVGRRIGMVLGERIG